MSKTARSAEIEAFLTASGWAGARRRSLAGDASARRYFRIDHDRLGGAVLMDAPPETGETVAPFVDIAAFLRGNDLSAPDIVAVDAPRGLMLLEDLGDDLFSRILARAPEREPELYDAAVDVLAALAALDAPEGLPRYDPERMAALAGLSLDWYAAGTRTQSDHDALQDAMREALDTAGLATADVILRDYHADNLIWLPDRRGTARVGLLDFQDAAIGDGAYDLVSLLEDARRDVSAEARNRGLDRFAAATGADREALSLRGHVLSAQRNLRIIGVFARLCLRDNKPHYPDFLPRCWAHLMRDLAHPELAELHRVVTALLPPPDAARIAAIKASAGSRRDG